MFKVLVREVALDTELEVFPIDPIVVIGTIKYTYHWRCYLFQLFLVRIKSVVEHKEGHFKHLTSHGHVLKVLKVHLASLRD